MGVVTGSHLDHLVDWEQAKQNPFIGLPAQSHDSSERNLVWEATAWKKVLSSWWINQLNILLLWNVAKRVMYEHGNWKMEYGLCVTLARQQQLLECCILWWCPQFEADGDELMNTQRTAIGKMKTIVSEWLEEPCFSYHRDAWGRGVFSKLPTWGTDVQ